MSASDPLSVAVPSDNRAPAGTWRGDGNRETAYSAEEAQDAESWRATLDAFIGPR